MFFRHLFIKVKQNKHFFLLLLGNQKRYVAADCQCRSLQRAYVIGFHFSLALAYLDSTFSITLCCFYKNSMQLISGIVLIFCVAAGETTEQGVSLPGTPSKTLEAISFSRYYGVVYRGLQEDVQIVLLQSLIDILKHAGNGREGTSARSCIFKNGTCQPGKWHGCFISVFNIYVCIGRGKYTYISMPMQLNSVMYF